MAHTFRTRVVSSVPAGSTAHVTLTAGTNGIFLAEAWDLNSATVHEAVPIPGATVPVGSVQPPSVVYVQGVFAVAMTPGANKIEVDFRNAAGKVVARANPVPLSGAAGDSIILTVFVF